MEQGYPLAEKMKPLHKSDRRHFDELCRKIREALHLEHWESEYTIETKQPDDDPKLFAQHRSFVNGRRLWIAIYPNFWNQNPQQQITTLIHEHIHGVMQTADQITYRIIDWAHDADQRWANKTWTSANEHVVDHLTSVLYDLLKDRL